MIGIISLLNGNKYNLRAYIFINSLREQYFGPATFLHNGVSKQFLKMIERRVDLVPIQLKQGLVNSYLLKTQVNRFSPFDNTIFMDTDMLVLKPFTKQIFKSIDKYGFTTTKTEYTVLDKIPHKRINQWRSIQPRRVKKCLRSKMPAINTGVFGFRRNHEIFSKWSDLAVNGFSVGADFAEEIACQLLLPEIKHNILGSEFNAGCTNYHNEDYSDARVVHYYRNRHIKWRECLGHARRLWRGYLRNLQSRDKNVQEIIDKWGC